MPHVRVIGSPEGGPPPASHQPACSWFEPSESLATAGAKKLVISLLSDNELSALQSEGGGQKCFFHVLSLRSAEGHCTCPWALVHWFARCIAVGFGGNLVSYFQYLISLVADVFAIILVASWAIGGVPGIVTKPYLHQSIGYVVLMTAVVILGLSGYRRRKSTLGCSLIRVYASIKGLLYSLRVVLAPLALGLNTFGGSWTVCCSGLELSSSAIFSVVWLLVDMYMLWIVWSFLVVCQYRHSLRLQRRSTDPEGSDLERMLILE